MSDITFRNEKTGKRAKVTTFTKEYAKRNGHGRYYVALFQKDQLSTNDGWYCDNKKHAYTDAKEFVKK